MLHAFAWAAGDPSGGIVDLFAGQTWLTSPPAGDFTIGYATSPNLHAQVVAWWRCVPYPGENSNSNLFLNAVNQDVAGVSTYAGYQTAAPP
jgi:hypothetical protein